MNLEPHHQLAVHWLVHHPHAALFMGMGLGKTACTLTAFDGLRTLGDVKSMLVVAPLRVCNLTWPNEIEKWPEFRHLKVANLRTAIGWRDFTEGRADIYLCNYEMLPKVAKYKPRYDIVVFDELTRAKNPKSKRINEFRSMLNVAGSRIRRWGLTGTPTPNSLLELFAQVRLLDGGKRLGPSFDTYQRTYFYPTDYMEYNWEELPGARELIYGRVSDLALTLLSSEFLDIPDTSVVDLDVTIPGKVLHQYEALEKELVLQLGSDPDNLVIAQSAAVLVNKLLQVAGGAVYQEDGTYGVIHNEKIDALQKYLKAHPEPALIAYNYRHELERLKLALPHAVAFEDAKTPHAQQVIEKAWNHGKIPQLLVHPASAGHGLNFQHGGATVIWFSPTWSREHYDQLNGRVIRSGQTKPTIIVRIICGKTMDDAVIETLREKDLGQKALLSALNNYRKMLAT